MSAPRPFERGVSIVLVILVWIVSWRAAPLYAQPSIDDLPALAEGTASAVPLPSTGGDLAEATPSASQLVFGIYPGGGTGETSNVSSLTDAAVLARLHDLARGTPFVVHLYTAWSWYDPTRLDAQVRTFGEAGYGIILTLKYSPPPGHDGDVAGYEDFVRTVVSRYATNPALRAFVVGNEANVTGNPNSSDGPFARSHLAVVRGLIAARRAVQRANALARVGFNFAVTDPAGDATFLQDLVRLGGDAFSGAVGFVGIDVYPGLWPAGRGPPYQDMRTALVGARASIDGVPGLRGRPIDLLEVGAPTADEQDQARRLQQVVRATEDLRAELNLTSFIWFDLWDADSQSPTIFGHYGLSRSDLSPKPAFLAYQRAIAASREG